MLSSLNAKAPREGQMKLHCFDRTIFRELLSIYLDKALTPGAFPHTR